jgi:hypothetical protein
MKQRLRHAEPFIVHDEDLSVGFMLVLQSPYRFHVNVVFVFVIVVITAVVPVPDPVALFVFIVIT